MIVFAAIVPHPPESIPGIGKKEDFEKIKKTLNSFDILREGLEKARPDTILIISPHAHMEPYSFVINSASDLKGGFSKFGLDETMSFKNDIEIADKISYRCQMDDVPAHLHPSFIDHGTLVPLFHLTKNINVKVIHLSFSLMSYERHYNYGQVIGKIIDDINLNRRVAIIASGDLSHRLAPDAPAGFSPEAVEFDRRIIHYLGNNDLANILGLDKTSVEEVAECGLRSILVLLGALHEKKHSFELLSYEGPFGVGYLTARLI